jgi:hypothetical protein
MQWLLKYFKKNFLLNCGLSEKNQALVINGDPSEKL